MDKYPTKLGLGREVFSWLEGIGYNQATHVLMCIAKIFKFAEESMDFFQGCGLYVVGSSLRGGNFNDVDIVLVGLDFRAVVSYDKIFLMDPETLVEKGILVEPQFFAIIDHDEKSGMIVRKPVTEIDGRDLLLWVHQFNHAGMEFGGKKYDYNFEKYGDLASDLTGYCAGQAGPSDLTKTINKLFNPDDEFSLKLSHPFDHYGFGGTESFLVYRISMGESESDLPVAKDSVVEEMKPIDLSIHAENLDREAWKRHQSRLRLPYLTLKEWPQTRPARKITTELEYPRFIDPNGAKRAERDMVNFASFDPDEIPEAIEI